MSPREAARMVGQHRPPAPEHPAMKRAREQARCTTDKAWGDKLIADAEREAARPEGAFLPDPPRP